MTNEERLKDVLQYEAVLKETLTPLLSENNRGLVALRLFACVKHDDGTRSVLNVGACEERNVDDAAYLVGVILEALIDTQGNRTFERSQGPAKH